MAQTISRNIIIVRQDELGTNCWMPIRFLDRCKECFRYEKCSYLEKKADAVYDALLREKNNLNGKLKAVRKEIARLSGKFG